MSSIYHFTDLTNLESIIAEGVVRCPRDAPVTVEIGNRDIKDNRKLITVSCGPGGTVCDYVPFYYATRSPMLSAIIHGRVPGVDTDQRRLVYLVSSTDAMYAAGQECVFTDGNAAVFGLTEFDDSPANLATHIDWAIMREQYWANTPEDNDRRRRRMAEFLVYEQVPIALFTEIGVYDAPMKSALEDAIDGDWAVPVNVRRSWYF